MIKHTAYIMAWARVQAQSIISSRAIQQTRRVTRRPIVKISSPGDPASDRLALSIA
jgi:hypothetical protein